MSEPLPIPLRRSMPWARLRLKARGHGWRTPKFCSVRRPGARAGTGAATVAAAERPLVMWAFGQQMPPSSQVPVAAHRSGDGGGVANAALAVPAASEPGSPQPPPATSPRAVARAARRRPARPLPPRRPWPQQLAAAAQHKADATTLAIHCSAAGAIERGARATELTSRRRPFRRAHSPPSASSQFAVDPPTRYTSPGRAPMPPTPPHPLPTSPPRPAPRGIATSAANPAEAALVRRPSLEAWVPQILRLRPKMDRVAGGTGPPIWSVSGVSTDTSVCKGSTQDPQTGKLDHHDQRLHRRYAPISAPYQPLPAALMAREAPDAPKATLGWASTAAAGPEARRRH